MKKNKLSIVTSLYYSSSFIEKFYNEYMKVIQKLNVDYEFIFVDDGSPDNSIEKVLELKENDEHISLIILTRNFGQHPAMFAGIKHAKGDYIYVCDADLEEPTEILVEMFEDISTSENLDMIYSVFRYRKGGFVRGTLGGIYYTVLNYLSDQNISKNQSWQRIMTKRYTMSLLEYTELESLPVGLMKLTGYIQKELLIDRNYKGYSSYNITKRFKQALNGIVLFSSKPLIIISLIGFFITFISFLFITYLIFQKIYNYQYQAGWASIIVSIWFVGGVIISSIGLIGIYLSKIFNQVKNRPLYLIKEII